MATSALERALRCGLRGRTADSLLGSHWGLLGKALSIACFRMGAVDAGLGEIAVEFQVE